MVSAPHLFFGNLLKVGIDGQHDTERDVNQPSDRSRPSVSPWPRAATSAAIFRGDEVLIGRRGKSPRQDVWSLPGGHIEPGETAAAAARREVFEETAIEAEILGLVDTNDVVIRGGDGELMAHYLLVIHFGRYISGSPVAGDDCVEARFIPLERIVDFKTTDRLAHFITKAHERFRAHDGGLD